MNFSQFNSIISNRKGGVYVGFHHIYRTLGLVLRLLYLLTQFATGFETANTSIPERHNFTQTSSTKWLINTYF